MEYSKKLVGLARRFFEVECNFVMSVANVEQLPSREKTEVAFAGRSNVGKSSLINALTNRKNLARSSKTPGRTQHLNFFEINQDQNSLYLVDLPGYGYAKASKSAIKDWNELIIQYLKGRPNLTRIMLLVDSRHGLKKNDLDIMKLLDDVAVTYQIVLTKCDKVKKSDIEKLLKTDYIKHPAMHPKIIATSADKKIGLDDLRSEIYGLL